MSKKQDGLRILKAEIENFKNIDYNELQIDGRSMVIAGKNEAGKSSLIQALVSPFNSTFTPLEPIKEGEERGKLEITIGGELEGEPIKYKVSTYFTPGNKKGRLVLEDSQGNKIKGGEKTFLDSIIGDISFDIMKFVDLSVTENGKRSTGGSKQQVEMVKSLLPIETLKNLAKLDHERVEKYDARTEVNRDVKFYKSKIDASEFSQEEIEKYSEEKSVEDIQESIKKANKFNEAHEQCVGFRQKFDAREKEQENIIAELALEIEKAQNQLSELKDKKTEVDAFLEKNPKPKDISALEESLTNLSQFNTKVAQVKELDQTKVTLKTKEDDSQVLSDRIDAIDAEKKEIFANADMPVKGLAFNDEGVTYKGLPLCETNQATSVILGVGARIAMALNPNLRLIVVKRGESLDKDRMNALLKICNDQGYQLLIEKVDSEKEKLEIEFVEK
jgi:predicted ATP-dependent endonuclease of OLD family